MLLIGEHQELETLADNEAFEAVVVVVVVVVAAVVPFTLLFLF